MEHLGRDDIWDIHVPVEHNYSDFSSGVVHGNSGGKTTVGCRESIRYTLAFARSRNAVSRFHYDDLTDTTMVSYFEALDRIGLSDGSRPGMRHYIFRKSPRPEITWWNGSSTLFRNLDDPSGSKYGSMEVSTWFIDEGFEVPEDVLRVIYPSRLRWHLRTCPWKEKIEQLLAAGGDPSQLPCACPRRMWACTNPGPNAFWEAVVTGKMPNAEHFAVPFRENMALGTAYYDGLEETHKAYGPAHLARWAYGSWDAFEGQRFTMLDRERHFLATDLDPRQPEFDIIEAHDFGYRNPHATVWIAVHAEREYPPIVVDDYEVAEREIPKHAEAILARRRQYEWRDADILAVGDPAGMQTRGAGVSDIMLFAAHGVEIVPMTRAKMPDARADLLALMLSRGVVTRDGAMAGLMFNPRAHRTYERMLKYRYADKSRTSQSDAPEKFQKKDDHLVDAVGYGVSAIGDPLEREDTETRAAQAELIRSARMPTPDELNAQAFAAG